jgi:hypothetical protein
MEQIQTYTNEKTIPCGKIINIPIMRNYGWTKMAFLFVCGSYFEFDKEAINLMHMEIE